MKVLKAEAKAVNNEIELIVIGDTHIGSRNFNEQLLDNAIEYILSKDNVYCCLNGDILDATFVTTKVGNSYENKMTPSNALAYAIEKLKPLVDAKKCLCTIGGNHDHDRSSKIVDVSLAQQLAVGLGIPELFSADSVCLFLRVYDIKGAKNGSVIYKIFLSHGQNGNGANISSKSGALNRMSDVVTNADIYVHSHTHAPLSFKDEYIEMVESTGTIVMKERLYINTSAFLTWQNSYGEKKLMRPQSLSIPIIKMKAKRYRHKDTDRIFKTLKCEI